MRRRALLLACALALLLAGCSGTDPGPTESVSPAQPPTVPTEAHQTTTEPYQITLPTIRSITVETPTPDPTPTARPNATFQGVDMPPGTDTRGIVDIHAFRAANLAALSETPFRLVHNESTTVWEDGNRTHASDTTLTARLSTDTGRYHYSANRAATDRPNVRTQVYLADGMAYARLQRANVTYDARPMPADQYVREFVRYRLDVLGDGRDWTPTTTTTIDGREVVVFEFSPSGLDETDEVQGRLLVDSRGVIHRLAYRFDTGRGTDSHRRSTYTYDVDPVSDIDVEPPEWLAQAKNATRTPDGVETTLPRPTTTTAD